MEVDWQKNHYYTYLLYKNEHERAKLSITLIRELKDYAKELFDNESKWLEISTYESFVQLVSQDISILTSEKFFYSTISQFLGAIEELAEFAKNYLVVKWVSHFKLFIESPNGTSAWRACEQLWQTNISTSLNNIQQENLSLSQDTKIIDQDIKQIKNWLSDWKQQINITDHNEQTKLLITSLEEIYNNSFNKQQKKLEELSKNSELLLTFFRERFNKLDSDKVINNFLQKELLRDLNVNLEQAGHQTEEKISLSKVFVDLPISDDFIINRQEDYSFFFDEEEEDDDNELSEGFINKIIKISAEPLDLISLNTKKEMFEKTNKKNWEEIQKEGKYVLIGGPGQGKSTIGQLICQLFRTSILQKKQPEILDYRIKNILKEFTQLCKDEDISLPDIPRIPFRILLDDFAKRLGKSGDDVNSVLSYITTRITLLTNQSISTTTLHQWLQNYPWIIIFDGLDEVPASANRNDVIRAIEEFWIDANANNADILAIATTRPQGYSQDFSSDYYQHKYLIPLSKTKAKHYGERLVKTRYQNDEERQKKVLTRLALALKNKTTARLMQSPLQVTIMASLLARIGTPPQERWSLFNQYYEVIYERETERDIPSSAILRDYKPDINTLHHCVGLILQIESEYTEGTTSKLSIERFSQVVEKHLEEEGHTGENLNKLKNQIIEASMNRLVFLVGLEDGEIGFEIRSLQEFMASEALMNGYNELVKKRLTTIAPIAHWLNVFLFAAGKCFVDRLYLRDTIFAICAEINEINLNDQEIIAITKTGSQLALELLEDGSVLRQPKSQRILTRLAFELLEHPPNSTLIRLAKFFLPETRMIFFEEINKYVNYPFPKNLGAWTILGSISTQMEMSEIIKNYWPSEQNSQLRLLDSIVTYKNSEFIIPRIIDLLPMLPIEKLVSYEILENIQIEQDGYKWIQILINTFHPIDEFFIPFYAQNKNDFSLRFCISPIKNSLLSNWDMKESERIHRDWLPIQAAARFINQPCKEILANELSNLAELISFPFTFNATYSALLPWPFTIMLSSVKSKEELIHLINKLKKGSLGDISDWLKAEKRWFSKGISINDIEYISDDRFPFDHNIALQGIPISFNNFRFSWQENPNYNESRSLLKNLINSPKHSKIHTQLIEMNNFLFELDCLSENSTLTISPEDLAFILHNSENFIIIDILLKLEICIPKQEFLQFADELGNKEIRFVHFNYPIAHEKYQNLCKKLEMAYIDNRNYSGILNILIEFYLFGYKIDILNNNNFIESSNNNNYLLKAILQLSKTNISKTEIDSLINQLSTKNETQEKIIRSLSKMIRNHSMNNEPVTYLLINLYRSLRDNNKLSQIILETLHYIKIQNQSNLVELWAELELPKNLDKLIFN